MILALDQSTSATKALLFAADGQIVDREARDHAQHYPQPGWVEHDAEEIWQNTLTVLRALAARASARGETLDQLSLTNQRETIVAFSRQTGRPVYRALVWQCRRGLAICERHLAAGQGPLVARLTGLKIDTYFSGSKLQWLVENVPGLREGLSSGDILVGTIDAYLLYRLTGGQVFATDSTNASRTLLFSLDSLQWDPALAALWGIPLRALPEVRDSFAAFGSTTLDGALARPLPIRGVMGDSQAALYAQSGDGIGSAKVTFGTGSSLLLNCGTQRPKANTSVVTSLAWSRGGVPTYALEGIIISSASTLTWLRDQLRLLPDISRCEEIARSVPDNQGVYLVPAFTGLGLPYWKADARAALVGLTAQSDYRHVVRAALESIAYQVRDALHALRQEAGVSLSRLHADGGPTANGLLMQFTADLAGVDLQVSTLAECSAFGAVLAGLEAADCPLPPLQRPAPAVTYSPSLPAPEVQRLLAGWHNAVQLVTAPTPCPSPSASSPVSV